MMRPSPGPATSAAIVAVAQTCTSASRTPVMTTGIASGSSTAGTSATAHPHAAGRLDDVAVDLAHADVGVGDERRQREEHEGDQGRQPSAAVGPELAGPDRAERQHQQHREHRDGPPDVGDVDGQEAAAAEVAEPERERQPEHHRDGQRRDGQQQLLHREGADPGRPGPVRAVGEVVEDVSEHGGSTASAGAGSTTSTRSSTTASATHSRLAAKICALNWLPTASAAGCPSPPYETIEPIVARATVETVATRRPAMMTGSASGSSTRASSRVGPYPTPDGRLAHLVGHRLQAGEHVADQDRQRVERETDDHGRRRRARSTAAAARTAPATGSCR